MKKSKIVSYSLVLLLFVFTGFISNAQEEIERDLCQGKNRMHEMLNLSEEQKTKIDALQSDHLKEMIQLKNKLNELEAKKQTLSTEDKVDMKAINSNIDEISNVQNKIMKKNAEHHQSIRELLTDEQRVKFDSYKHHRNFDHGMNRVMKKHHPKMKKQQGFQNY